MEYDMDFDDYLDDFGDYPEELYDYGEPAIHRTQLYTQADGSIKSFDWTNDNLDRGYPSEDASWEGTFKNLKDALAYKGGSRAGAFCDVEVYLDGVQITQAWAEQKVAELSCTKK